MERENAMITPEFWIDFAVIVLLVVCLILLPFMIDK